ncbi:MAG TPA: O-antigen ligase family protein [Verrucomicrobiae bacterium]|nr:O-antigen ligase family protein [Verrucomicrobiae bacterium]
MERQVPDIFKAIILLGMFGITPVIGFLIRNSQRGQRIAFGLMCFMTTGGILGASEWGLTLSAFEYRSHARGFHFYFICLPALAIIFAKIFTRWRDVKLVPPGFWLFYTFCVCACMSIVTAEFPTYVLMAAWKTVELTVIGIAAYNFIRTDRDLKFLIHCMACTMAWQFVVALKMKYLDGIYQVYGTFEHQNSLSTFTTMIGLVFLGAALAPKEEKSNWFMWVYIFCAFIVQSALSRGSLFTFALGSVIVVVLSLVDRVTKRRMTVLVALAAVAAVGLAFTMDTLMARFKGDERYNEESKHTRDMLNQASRNMVAEHPLGVGWNNYGRMINHPYHYGDHIDAYQKKWSNQIDPNYQKGISESLYYLILAENGYLSLVVYVAFFALFLIMNLRGAMTFRTDMIGGFSIGLFAGCGVIYLQSFLERVLTQPRNMALWFLLLGAAARIETWRRKEAHLRKQPLPELSQFERDELSSLSEPVSAGR